MSDKTVWIVFNRHGDPESEFGAWPTKELADKACFHYDSQFDDDPDSPRTAVQYAPAAELERLRAENTKMRAVLDRCAKITADGEWAVAGDWLWYPLGGQPRKFRVDANMTVPVSVPTAGSWRDLAVEEAYFHKENALAAKGANDE